MSAFAIECDCEIRIFPPTVASQNLAVTPLKVYQLESYDSLSQKSQWSCRNSCLKKFQDDMPSVHLNALLSLHTEKLVQEKLVGFNCTGLTTLKYPVRVKASLGNIGLGNVIDQMVVINHEEVCF